MTSRNPAPIGNTYGIGNPGPVTRNPLTQVLLSQLHEIDRDTKQENKHVIVAQMIKLAKGGVFKYKKLQKDKRGVMRMMWVEEYYPPDGNMIREIFDRVQGKAPQQVNVDASIGPRTEETAHDRLKQLLDLTENASVVEGTATEVTGPVEP